MKPRVKQRGELTLKEGTHIGLTDHFPNMKVVLQLCGDLLGKSHMLLKKDLRYSWLSCGCDGLLQMLHKHRGDAVLASSRKVKMVHR